MQFPIKINQTNLSDGERQKSTSQTKAPVNSFDQILASYNFLGRTLASDGLTTDFTTHNESEKEESKLIEQTFPSEEEWSELDSILAAWIAGIQQGQYSQETPHASLYDSKTANKTILPVRSPMGGSLKQTTTDDSNGLVQWLQKVENTNPTTTLNPAGLMVGLEKVISELHLQDIQNPIEVPDDKGDKFQLILDESKTENKFVGITPVIRQSDKNPFFFDNEINVVSLNSMQDGKTAASPPQNVFETKGNDQTNLTNLSSEDRWKLNTSLVSETQVSQQIHITPPGVPNNGYSGSESQRPEISAALLSQQQQQATSDHGNALAKWLQKVEGRYQASISDSSTLIQRLAHFIGELQLDDNQNSIEIPSNIEGKIQMILDDVFTSPSSLISKFVPRESSPDDLSFSHDDSISFLNQQQKSEGWNVSKAATLSPILTVSEFVPEVSGWIGGYLRSTNGQLGSTEARFSLYPEHLGHIEIKITSQLGQISAQILAETGLAKEALEGQIHQLRQALQQHGLLVKNLEVVQQQPASVDANQANLAFSQGDSNSPQEQRTFATNQNVSKKHNESDDETEIEKEHLSVSYGRAAPKTASQIDFTA
jgi:flagellar hook-length control protein FliK